MRRLTTLLIALTLIYGGLSWTVAGHAATQKRKKSVDVTKRQQAALGIYKELEAKLITLAEDTARTDPQQAAFLRRAVKLGKQQAIQDNFGHIIERLRAGGVADFDQASKRQRELKADLKQLLELLSSQNQAKRIESEKKRIRSYIKKINRLIKQQEGVQGRTQGGDDAKQLAERQAKLAEQTDKLGKEIKHNEEPPEEGDSDSPKKPAGDSQKPDGQTPPKDKPKTKPADGEKSQPGKPGGDPKPGDSKSGKPKSDAPQPLPKEKGHPARRRLEQARKRMQQAQEKLEEAKRDGAAKEQDQALQELNQALAELEQILRQLREEEIEQVLTLLETRFQRMLKRQTKVYEATKKRDKVPVKDRTRDDDLAATRLSRDEKEIIAEADRALTLLRDDGTAAAFPVALEHLREDMVEVAGRLAEAHVGAITQGVEEDVIAALEEMIAAFKKAIKDQEEKKGKKRSGGKAGGPQQEPPLVDIISELKMIRSLQLRVNRRTKRYHDLGVESGGDSAELRRAKNRLAQREREIHKIMHDLILGKNQ